MVLACAVVPIDIAPVPAFRTTDDAPVTFPMVIVFALAPVPRFIAPVVPESILKALADAVVISVPIVPVNNMPLVAVPEVFVSASKLVVVPPAPFRLILRPAD